MFRFLVDVFYELPDNNWKGMINKMFYSDVHMLSNKDLMPTYIKFNFSFHL